MAQARFIGRTVLDGRFIAWLAGMAIRTFTDGIRKMPLRFE
jgi:hypothetical protein